jgi:Matrixin/CARDB
MNPARKVLLVAIALTALLMLRPEASSYEFWWKNDNPSTGINYRWSTGWARMCTNPVQWTSSERGQVAAACATWGAVDGSSFFFEHKLAGWDPGILTGWNAQNDVYIDNLGPGTLGLTAIPISTGTSFSETDIIIAPDVASSISADLQTVVLHELGHAFGLDHESDVPAVMNPYINGVQRTPFPDDEDGIRALYPPQGGPIHHEGPDVAVAAISHAPSLQLGKDILVSWTFENRGTVPSSSFDAVVYLDGEKTPSSATGQEMDRIQVTGLSPDRTIQGSATVKMPDSLLPGKWYLGVRAEGVVDDVNVTNNGAAPVRPLEIKRAGIFIGARDQAIGTLGPYGEDGYFIDLLEGLTLKAKLKATRVSGIGSKRHVDAKLGIHRPGISIPFDWDVGRKNSVKVTTSTSGRHEIRVSNRIAVPMTYTLKLKIKNQLIDGSDQVGTSIPFMAWIGGSILIRLKGQSVDPILTLVDPDGDPMDLTERLRIKGGGRKVKVRLKEVTKNGLYTLNIGGTPAGYYVDYSIEILAPMTGIVHERD